MPFLLKNLTTYRRIVREYPSLVNPRIFDIDKELLVEDIEEDLIVDKNILWRKFKYNNKYYYVVEGIGKYVYIEVEEKEDNTIFRNIKFNSAVTSVTYTKNSWFPYVTYDNNFINNLLKLEGNELKWNENESFVDLKGVKLYDKCWLICNLDQSNIYIKISQDNLYNYYAFVTNTTKFYSANYNKNKTPHINGGGFILEKNDIESILENIRSLQED